MIMTMLRHTFTSVMVGSKRLLASNRQYVVAGRLSPKARALVLEWADIHQAELMADWELTRQQAPLNSIDPLE